MKPCIIKTEDQYEQALARIETLMLSDPGVDTDEGRDLDLLAMLIENYENEVYPMDLPSPIEAIKFRMEQEGLKQKDLKPYIGSLSKISEVLNGKRSLSLTMIRKLHAGLGISAEVLLATDTPDLPKLVYEVSAFPFSEMFKRNYIRHSGSLTEAKGYAEELLTEFFAIFGEKTPKPVYCRSGNKDVCQNSLLAWQAQALYAVKNIELPSFKPQSISIDFATTIAKLSYTENGVETAIDFLNKKGIHVTFLKHLTGTKLDGGCFMSPSGNPVIGITLRYDRIDNFWFTLLHELGHAHLHLSDDKECSFFDSEENQRKSTDQREIQANNFASNALIPETLWEDHRENLLSRPTVAKVETFAEHLNIHSAIVAGRIRFEKGRFNLLPKIQNNGNLRERFNY